MRYLTTSAYLTTPIYYVNDAPHVGHAYTTVIADALSRWQRLRGVPTRLVTGTDEHGQKVQRAAAAAGLAPATLAERTSAQFGRAWDRLGIEYDQFVRTTSARHREVVIDLLTRVHDAGYIHRGRYTGRYCVPCEAYVAEEVCPIHRRPTEWVSEENWFFALSRCTDVLVAWFDRCPEAIQPVSRRNEALSLLRGGLSDFSISRAGLDWGIPLPWDPSQVTYVWFDALGSYLTGIGWPDPAYRRWWPAHHVIGKDILRFHALYWPAILHAAGIEPPARITVHGFLLQQGEKIAKSGGGASLTLDRLLDEVGTDGLRYWLLRDNPIGPDGHFSAESVLARYNSDLANTLGNLQSRVAALVDSLFGGVGPACSEADSPLSTVAFSSVAAAAAAWDRARPSEALAAVWRLVAAANSYLVAEQPWREAPGSPRAAAVLGDVLEALRIVAVLVWPAIPAASEELWRRIGLPGRPLGAGDPDRLAWGGYPGGSHVTRGAPLFPRVRTGQRSGVLT